MNAFHIYKSSIKEGTLTISWANEGQTAGIRRGADHTSGSEQGRSFCVLEEAGVRLSLFQIREALY